MEMNDSVGWDVHRGFDDEPFRSVDVGVKMSKVE